MSLAARYVIWGKDTRTCGGKYFYIVGLILFN